MKKDRIEIIDALRGLAVVLMVAHHFLFDLVTFLGAPEYLFTNPVLNIFHYFFAGLFIFLSGVSSNFSRSNVKRGLKTLAVALAITLVTWAIGMPDIFGVLHLLAFCMLFYGLTRKLWEKIPRTAMALLCVALTAFTAILTAHVTTTSKFLWMFGFPYPGFYSSDYFPILPWVFVFLLGTWAGEYIVEKKLPSWFYDTKVPFFPKVGQKALLIYVVHQPVLFGITWLIALLTGQKIL